MRKQAFEKKKYRAGEGMVRNLNSLAPNTRPSFIGYDFIDGEFVKTNKIEEVIVNRNNQHYYEQMCREGALIDVTQKDNK